MADDELNIGEDIYAGQTLGAPIPLDIPHALSVSLPTWKDNVGWALADPCVVEKMVTGYPRFFVHRNIQRLASLCLDKIGERDRLAMLFPTARTVHIALSYLEKHTSDLCLSAHFGVARLHIEGVLCSDIETKNAENLAHDLEVHVLMFPSKTWKLAKSCWQHAGMGISSRYAERCLSLLDEPRTRFEEIPEGYISFHTMPTAGAEKRTIRRRISNLISGGPGVPFEVVDECATLGLPEGQYVREDDVFLYPSGMSAIWQAYELVCSLRPDMKCVCFGFPYTDTLKVLQKWGPGCEFFGDHPDVNLASLETFLTSSEGSPISVLFCECPSNPLLQSPDLQRLRQLADEHGFLIVIDDTVGNFVNVDVLRYVDVVATSLSKLFSGAANVMGGSLTLNPNSRHYSAMKCALAAAYVDDYFYQDAVVMERNSRDFAKRVGVIDANAETVCDFLRSRSLSCIPQHKSNGPTHPPSSTSLAIKEVFFPKWTTREHYDLSRRQSNPNCKFGGLFSLTFVSPAASRAFFDALPCAKGPSLGTNFTLACPYTILAHYNERPWAESYGVEEGIVRVSVGCEEQRTLLRWMEGAVSAAECAIAEDSMKSS